jgi:hypothetical protein
MYRSCSVLDWRFLERGHWAGASYGWPCSPIGTIGSDWEREKLPRTRDENALQISFWAFCRRCRFICATLLPPCGIEGIAIICIRPLGRCQLGRIDISVRARPEKYRGCAAPQSLAKKILKLSCRVCRLPNIQRRAREHMIAARRLRNPAYLSHKTVLVFVPLRIQTWAFGPRSQRGHNEA